MGPPSTPPSAGLTLEERERIRMINQQLTAKKAHRLQLMRDQDRERAIVKDVAFSVQLEAAQRQQAVLVDQEQKQQAQKELWRLSDVFERRMAHVGQAHVDAAAVMQQRERQRIEQELRDAELNRIQEQRFQEALSKRQAQQGVGKAKQQEHVRLRAQILEAERSKARAFAAEQQERDRAQKRKQQDTERLQEQQRRRSPRKVDFRHSRLHERALMPLDDQNKQPAPSPFYDPRQEAEDYARRRDAVSRITLHNGHAPPHATCIAICMHAGLQAAWRHVRTLIPSACVRAPAPSH